MADINIERKESAPIWPWILGILALLIILALLFWPGDDDMENDDDDNRVADTTQTVQAEEMPATTATTGTLSQPVQEFSAWVKGSEGEMGLGHEYTSNGLRAMTAAISAIAMQTKDSEKGEFMDKFKKARKKAEAIKNDPMDTDHANKIKAAFQANLNVIKELQASSFPDLEGEVDMLKNKVDNVDPKTLTLEQKSEVKDVFQRSASLLEKMDMRIDG